MRGECEIIDGNLRLCLAYPSSVVPRILLTQTLMKMKKVRPAIVAEFKEKIAHLQKEQPLPEPAQTSVQQAMNEVFVA